MRLSFAHSSPLSLIFSPFRQLSRLTRHFEPLAIFAAQSLRFHAYFAAFRLIFADAIFSSFQLH
jgi:hypothetical protein